MTGYGESDSGFIFSFVWPLDDGPIELAPEQESQLVRWAEGFNELVIPPGTAAPEVHNMFPHFAAFMQRAWQDREMPPAIAAFITRFGS